MARREALRELQNRLAERMKAARSEQRSVSWLALEAGGAGFLVPLGDAGEIFSMADVLLLPHTQPWFCGVANLRGGLHGVVDLAVFLGLRETTAMAPAARDAVRLVALNPALGALCALRVDRLAGLRGLEQLKAEPASSGPRPAFARGRWRDAAGRVWQELDLAALAANEQFLAIAANAAG